MIRKYNCVSPLMTNKHNEEQMCDIGAFDEEKQQNFYYDHKGTFSLTVLEIYLHSFVCFLYIKCQGMAKVSKNYLDFFRPLLKTCMVMFDTSERAW